MDLTLHLELHLAQATEAAARVLLRAAPGSSVARVQGTIHGPTSAYARTLPAEYALSAAAHGEGGEWLASAVIPDPCYWTSELPFLYEMRLTATLADGGAQDGSHAIGLRRAEIHGANLRVERRRTVLRGAVCGDAAASDLDAARGVEAALIVAEPTPTLLQRASEIGVTLIPDLRRVGGALLPKLLEHTWYPAIAVVLLDERVDGEFRPPRDVPICQVMSATTDGNKPVARWARLVGVELGPGERPPAWLASCGKPVIAIRRGEPYAGYYQARAACDRLQAELAPEFDLAGYFVAK